MRRLASTLSVFLAVSIASAVTLQRLSQDDLTQKSTSIVYATVVDSYTAQHGSMIYTHYRVQVKENWKGTQQITEVMLPGGVLNGLRQTFAGVPALTPGNTYVMFLWAGPVGAPQLTGLTQGLFNVTGGAKGTLRASRPMTTEQLLDANGNAVHDQAVSMTLGEFKRIVTAGMGPGRSSR